MGWLIGFIICVGVLSLFRKIDEKMSDDKVTARDYTAFNYVIKVMESCTTKAHFNVWDKWRRVVLKRWNSDMKYEFATKIHAVRNRLNIKYIPRRMFNNDEL